MWLLGQYRIECVVLRFREELLEYYAKLSADATLREQRALWHVRRRKLQEQRAAFLDEQDKLLKEELDQQVSDFRLYFFIAAHTTQVAQLML